MDNAGKNALFAQARALLHLNTIPERYGLVLADDGMTGFLVSGVTDAVKALAQISAALVWNSIFDRDDGGGL